MQYSVSLGHIIDQFDLEVLHMPQDGRERQLLRADLHRPGLALAGFTEFFDNKRLLLMSRSEMAYLRQMDPALRRKRIDEMLAHRSPAVVLARGVAPVPELSEACERVGVPLLRSDESSTTLTSKLFEHLSIQLSPRTTVHGVLVEVYGWGVLIIGESGIGKSETAIELIKRGHRLVADDAVEIMRLPDGRLQGMAQETIRHFMEIRGIGMLDVRRLFGMSAVKLYENVLLVIKLENWDNRKVYDRLGLENETIEILDVAVPTITVPVRPGRNLATIVEVASMNARMKMMGYNSAKELERRILKSMNMEIPDELQEEEGRDTF
ncbi:MAG: HPr(Ser) kinase/phosphatase [Clostridia bacterium]|nr:HPr(Ser) kinase/phosphatase [Clostridia bacterium]